MRRSSRCAPDSIGLLHRVATALAEMGLDIRHATVQTIGPSVVDSFYVRTSQGAKVTDPYHRAEIERAVFMPWVAVVSDAAPGDFTRDRAVE